MLHFKVDRNRIQLIESSLNSEKNQVYKFFKKKSKDGDFNILVERGIWDGKDAFMTDDGFIPIGLWKEIYAFSKKSGIEVRIEGIDDALDLDLDRDKYTSFVDKLYGGILSDSGDPFYPRDYQFEGVYRALKHVFCCEELATSAGKTSIFYTYNSYLKHKGIIDVGNKALLIVPNVTLVNQTAKAFGEFNNGYVNWNIHKVGGSKDSFNLDKFKECDMLITTYQSLMNMIPGCLTERLDNLSKKKIEVKKGQTREDAQAKRAKDITNIKRKIQKAKIDNIASYFSVLCVDEAHKSRGKSISTILNSCKNWKYKLGLSGTMKIDTEYSDFYKMQENTGPLVMTLGAKFLIDNEYSPEIKIKQIFLEYNREFPLVSKYLDIQENKEKRNKIKSQFKDPKLFGKYMLDIEKDIIFASNSRLEFISKFTKRLNKNTLILFSDVKKEYGLNISKKILEWNPNTFYIDGEIDNEDRERFKEVMETNDGVVIVASYGTFATGIDLKRLFNIIFAESTKAEITIRQAIGRGMRKLKGKGEVFIWDIVDDLSGYSVRHSKERMKIYLDQEFEILKPVRIDLDPKK